MIRNLMDEGIAAGLTNRENVCRDNVPDDTRHKYYVNLVNHILQTLPSRITAHFDRCDTF